MPWLIITDGWPALTAQVAGAVSRLALEPAIVGVGTIAALASAGAILWRGRASRSQARVKAHAPVAASSVPAAPPPGS